MEENKEMAMTTANEEKYVVTDFAGIGRNTDTKTQVITNITDRKKIFNLENNVDCLLTLLV